MPYCECPKCGAVFHLNVGDVATWYRENHPDLKVGDMVRDLCFHCWKAENPDMPRDHQHNPDPNENAARIVREATACDPIQAASLEEAWAAWSSQIQKVDERGMTLLRAAFEAGWEAGKAANRQPRFG